MKEYLLLIHGNGYPEELSSEILQNHIDKYIAWVKKLSSTNQYIKGARLENLGSVIIDKGERVISDGPYLESKEIVGGYVLIKAKNLDEAIALSQNCPLSKDFVISVRSMYSWPVEINYNLSSE
ncbi:YciI family protein [uncultured Winogradskyella sp.]|uniref:YciI family protein n=1 Tax=uncultured Winogradskyella sp. TaxID=395353 RepID=UPI0026213DC3|nr:YciI family protein [uncultured Winogradskyella sp.]